MHGLVQGVGFRASLRAEALRLGLSGWVRNRDDGAVEAVAAGPAEEVEALVAWARRGPADARGADVQVSETSGRPLGPDEGFRVTG